MRSMETDRMDDALEGLDESGMRTHVERFPQYLAESAHLANRVPDPSGCDGVVVAGMGGSGIGAEVMKNLCRESLDVPVIPVHDYSIPRFVDEDYFFVAVSYSGNTEETISAFREARERGCETLAITSGGKLAAEEPEHVVEVPDGIPPRAALPQLLSPLVGVANRLGADYDLEAVAASLDDPRDRALGFARELEGSVPLIYGYGDLSPAAYRWKCQFNENAKTHAFWNYFPELTHNEVEGWPSADGFSCVLLRSDDGRQEERVGAAKEAALPEGSTLEASFEPGLGGVLSAIHLGDWVSLYLAALRGVDPTPVSTIEGIKELLS